MTHWLPPTQRLAFFLLLIWLAPAPPAFGQLDLNAIGGNAIAGAGDDQAAVTVAARIAAAKERQPARLIVMADIAPGWHIYSLTQKSGGPIASKITIDRVEGIKLAGEFTPDKAPETHPEPAFNNLPVETHEGQVIWSAPLDVSAGFDLATASISGKFSYQACDANSCRAPTSAKFTAAFDPNAAAPVTTPTQKKTAEKGSLESGSYQTKAAHAVLRGYLTPAVGAPGRKAQLVITIEPIGGYHVYALADRDPQKVSKPTLIVFEDTSGLMPSSPTAVGELVEKPSSLAAGETDRYYEKAVTWTVDLAIPQDAQPGEHALAGMIGFHTCNDNGCDMPQGAQFKVVLPTAANVVDGKIPLEFSPAKSYKQVADLAANVSPVGGQPAARSAALDITQLQPDTPKASEQSLAKMMIYGFLAGLILNLMPCVLPVIGLKLLSFVEQSGQERGRVLWLNIWYSLGILSVFLVLATLPVAFRIFQDKQFGWGQQFAYDGFNITLTAIIFAMALSLLGVWEIPIPGFVGGGTANDLAAKEGVAGAFAKGVLTTVLATPCSGPFLTTALAFAVAQPPALTYAMFACIGLGMAFPYLVIGAFPRLIQFLPKPGAWMDTFKQVMGFVLLGTVVYLMTVIQWAAAVPTVALLMGLWAGCWWIGRTPGYAEFGVKLRAWLVGGAVATAVGLVAFLWLGPIMADRWQFAVDREVAKQLQAIGTSSVATERPHKTEDKAELPWQPYSLVKLQELTAAGKTVMLDFTADWCQTCKALEKFVLNTQDTHDLVESNGIIPLVADMTRFPPEEASLLEKLTGNQSIPVLAIFPAGRPNEPIVLINGYTKGMLFEKLRAAGPSKDAATRTALAPAH